MLQRLCEVWGGGQRGEAFLGCSLKAEKRGEGRPASTDVPDRGRGASLHRDAAPAPASGSPRLHPFRPLGLCMGGGGGYSAGQRGSGHSAAPGRRYGLTRGEPRRAAPPPPLNFRGDCTTPGVGGGGGRRGVRPAGSAWTRTHGHGSTDTRTRAHGHGAPRSPRGLAGRTAALRDCARGTPRGAWTGGVGRGHSRGATPAAPPPDPSADSERELRCPSPPRGPPRSRAAAVTFPQGHGAARGSPGGGPGSGLQPAPRLAHLALHRLLRGTCGEAGGGWGRRRQGRAERSGAGAPRRCSPRPPPPAPYLCGAAWPACWGRASACTSCGPSGTARHGPAAPAGRVHPVPRAGPLTGRAGPAARPRP